MKFTSHGTSPSSRSIVFWSNDFSLRVCTSETKGGEGELANFHIGG